MIIGFAGPKGCGKGFVSGALLSSVKKEEYTRLTRSNSADLSVITGSNWKVDSFAEPLRAFILDLFNLDERHSNGYLKEVPINMISPNWHHIKAACQHHFNTDDNTELVAGVASIIDNKSGIFDDLVVSYRELMQQIGTELIRDQISENYWVDLMSAKRGNIIIDDVRMENEAEFVRNNGILIHIENPLAGFLKNHSTEVGVDRMPQDLVFLNNPSDVDTPFYQRIQKLKLEILEKMNG